MIFIKNDKYDLILLYGTFKNIHTTKFDPKNFSLIFIYLMISYESYDIFVYAVFCLLRANGSQVFLVLYLGQMSFEDLFSGGNFSLSGYLCTFQFSWFGHHSSS